MVVVRRVRHGLGDPGGVGVPCSEPCSPKALAGRVADPPLLVLDGVAAWPLLDGDDAAL